MSRQGNLLLLVPRVFFGCRDSARKRGVSTSASDAGGFVVNQVLDRKIKNIDTALQVLREERRRCSDPVDILHVSVSIDERLDERLRLMRARAS